MRPVTAEDFEAVMAIEKAAHFRSWPESVMRGYFKRNNCVWVLEDQQQIVAYAVNTLIADEAELLMIAVHPQHQGKGYGRTLMQQLQGMLEQQQAAQWFLDVRASNFKAIQLYESLGFNQAGRRPNYYPTERGSEDALLYCMSLMP